MTVYLRTMEHMTRPIKSLQGWDVFFVVVAEGSG